MASSVDALHTIPAGEVEDLVKCSICLEIFTEPKTLSTCSHTFCETCLINWVRNKREAAEREGNPTNNFECPECREPFTADTDETIKNMRCVHFVRNFHDLVIKQRQAKLNIERKSLRAHVESLQGLFINREEALRMVNKNSQQLKNDATRVKNEIHKDKERIQKIFTDELQRMAKSLTDQVDIDYQKKLDPYNKQQAVITSQLQKISETLNSVMDLLNNADYEKLLSSKKMVEQKADQVKQEGRDFKQVQPVSDGNCIEYQSREINDDELKKLVASCKMGMICKGVNMSFEVVPMAHSSSSKPAAFTAYLYNEDYDAICKMVQSYPDIETGGDLFGLWQDEENVVIQIFIGPGKKCKRTSRSFYQDVDYLGQIGAVVTQEEGLCNIGEWHSHHQLGMPAPSDDDKRTVLSNLPQLGLERFVLVIAHIKTPTGKNRNHEAVKLKDIELNCFMFKQSLADSQQPIRGKIHRIGTANPFHAKEKVTRLINAGAEPEPEVEPLFERRPTANVVPQDENMSPNRETSPPSRTSDATWYHQQLCGETSRQADRSTLRSRGAATYGSSGGRPTQPATTAPQGNYAGRAEQQAISRGYFGGDFRTKAYFTRTNKTYFKTNK